jgi:hypothetical protein
MPPVGDWAQLLAGGRLYLRSLSASSERIFFSFLRKRCVLASDAKRIAHESAYDFAASSYDDRIPYDSSSSATALSSAALPWSHSSSQAPSSEAYGSSRSNCDELRNLISQESLSERHRAHAPTYAVDLLVVTVGGPDAKLGRVVRVDQLELVTVAQDVELAAVLVALQYKSMGEGTNGASLELLGLRCGPEQGGGGGKRDKLSQHSMPSSRSAEAS